MSTTYVQALPNVRGRMSYTEHGEGERRREHLENGTDRIAAQMGDMPSREAFTEYCESLHGVHPNALNEGYELRVSWATDELKPDDADDVQRGLEYAYTLCHRLAPDSPCWVTMHTDGEGGCVHAHAVIANHDCRTGQVVNKEGTSLYAPRVQAVNDVLSRESGMSVLGADKERSTWAERRDEFEPDAGDVSGMAGELADAHAKRRRAEGKRTDDEAGRRFRRAQADPADALESLRAEVEAARQRFRDTKAEAEAVRSASPSFAASMYVYRFIATRSDDALSRLMAQMMAMMFQEMLRQMAREQERQRREEAEQRLYEARREMWDAEKALKAEERRLSGRRQVAAPHVSAEHGDKGLGE